MGWDGETISTTYFLLVVRLDSKNKLSGVVIWCHTVITRSSYTSNMVKDSDIVGHSLAEVLPHNPKYWFQTPHLLRLNLLLLVPLIGSSVAGYDGKSPCYTPRTA